MSYRETEALTTVVGTSPVLNTTAGVFTFTRDEQATRPTRVVVSNMDADTEIKVKVNGIASATAWDYVVNPLALEGSHVEIVGIRCSSISIWMPTGHAGVTKGTHYQVAGFQ